MVVKIKTNTNIIIRTSGNRRVRYFGICIEEKAVIEQNCVVVMWRGCYVGYNIFL